MVFLPNSGGICTWRMLRQEAFVQTVATHIPELRNTHLDKFWNNSSNITLAITNLPNFNPKSFGYILALVCRHYLIYKGTLEPHRSRFCPKSLPPNQILLLVSSQFLIYKCTSCSALKIFSKFLLTNHILFFVYATSLTFNDNL